MSGDLTEPGGMDSGDPSAEPGADDHPAARAPAGHIPAVVADTVVTTDGATSSSGPVSFFCSSSPPVGRSPTSATARAR